MLWGLKSVHLCYFQLSIDIKDKSSGKAAWELCTHWPSLLIGHVLEMGHQSLSSPLLIPRMNTEGLGAPDLLPIPFWMCLCWLPVHISGFSLFACFASPPPFIFLAVSQDSQAHGALHAGQHPAPHHSSLCSRGCDLLCSVSELPSAYF